MDWANEPYVRLYTRETTDDLELSWEALALWHALLRKFDRSGLMEARNGWSSVSKATRIPQEIAERAGAELVRDGRVRLVSSGVFAPNFVEAQTASKSDKVRQRESRDRRRARAESMQDMDFAPSNHAASHDVTTGHEASPNVTLCLASADPLLCSAEPLRIPQDKPAAKQDTPELADFKTKTDELAKQAKKARQKQGCVIPENWEPRPAEVAMAIRFGLDPASEAAHFRDHHEARGTLFKDWDAGFRTWLRNGAKFRSQSKNSNQSGGPSQALLRMAMGDT